MQEIVCENDMNCIETNPLKLIRVNCAENNILIEYGGCGRKLNKKSYERHSFTVVNAMNTMLVV